MQNKIVTLPENALRCSFCHKPSDVVAALISAPKQYAPAYICDQCVEVCNTILTHRKATKEEPSGPPVTIH